uniref:ATP-binding cassette sub-family A member 3-like isoform X3 n=1 Tax=Ciona intestinalis TaxID=7719 RepID=UPI00089DADBB|nr:ATP-binding cassette sub-family A member 3-like isoform X3 [Ciona intestinalis]|eukprot:XP_018668972.1 ATP-binding cassette sub-family A member 3-like isoform X3 [Ciona intestinalis]
MQVKNAIKYGILGANSIRLTSQYYTCLIDLHITFIDTKFKTLSSSTALEPFLLFYQFFFHSTIFQIATDSKPAPGSKMHAWDQFCLLFWKNFVLQKRRPIATVIELLLPLLFAVLLVIIRQEVDVTNYPNITTWREFSVNNLPEFPYSVVPEDEHFNIAYVPNNIQGIHDVMDSVKTRLNNVPRSRIEKKCNIDINEIKTLLANLDQDTPADQMVDSLPSGMKQVLEDVALESNTTASNLVFDAIISGNVDELMKKVSSRYMTQTMECLVSQLPQDQQDMMDLFSSTSNVTENSRTNSSSNLTSAFKSLISFFGVVPKINLISFPTEEDFLLYVKNDTNLKKTLAGVIFTGEFPDNTFSNNVKITFRFHCDPISSSVKDGAKFTGITDTWKTAKLFPGFQLPGPRSVNSSRGGKPGYYDEGFLALMHGVNMGIADTLTNTSILDNMVLKRFPFPPYIMDTFVIAIQRTLPLLVMLSFFYTSLVIVRSVVLEKESKMKEYMMMMGLSNWLHWLAWFVKYLIFLSISCFGMAGFYKIQTSAGSVLTYSDITVVFVFLFAFSAATITLCFLISVFFSKANVAAAAGGTLYGLTYMPYLFMENSYSMLSHPVKLISCLLSNVAMANGCQLFGMFEGKGTGIHWYNINQGVTVDDNFTLLEVILMLLLDAVLYMVLAVYIEGVWPGEYGIPKPWYFPFMKSYWFGVTTTGKYNPVGTEVGEENEIFADNSINGNDKEYFEDEPNNLRKVVEIKGLRKVFKGNKEKVAVDNLNINMYEGQITVLLGHNGAGKTTTMSMLTGFFPPTSGDAKIMGHSILDDMKGVRESLGLCPQFNILFDLLTVDEHLYFFARLKGIAKSEVKKECDDMRNILKLNDKASAQSCTLSGGMKRKLSVGIALSAGSKYVILDEPTSGMDPAARRAIWEVLQLSRHKCSILLSTHFMDEADLLGDRIAIMAEGKLRCTGSSVFLKNKFGVGYHVVLTKTPSCDVAKVDEIFRSHVKESKLERTAGGEISFVLPFDSSSSFPKLFQTLEQDAGALGVTNFGATVTTMEEVFLRVTEDANTAVQSVSRRLSFSKSEVVHGSPKLGSAPTNVVPSKQYLHSSLKYNDGVALWFQQFYALLIKRLLHSKRNYKVAVAQILVPVFFAIISIMNAKFPPFEQKNVPLDLSVDQYGPNNVWYNFTPNSPLSADLSQSYKSAFKGLESAYEVNEDIELFLANKYLKEGGDFNTENLIAGSFLTNTATNTSKSIAWFNNQAYHTPASTLLYMDQAYIRMVGDGVYKNFTMEIWNSPLPRNSTNRVQEQLLGSLSGFLIAFNIVLGFSFLAASFCIFLVRERVDRSSLLQALAGVDPVCFWMSTFTWDFINFITPCLLTMIMFAAFSVTEFTNHAGIAILLFILYCWASLPLMYVLSMFFQVPSTALVRITILNIITGLASIITVNVLRLLSLNKEANILDWVFLLMPQYCLGQGLADLYANDQMVNICTSDPFLEIYCREMGFDFQTNFLAWNQYGVGRFATFLGSQGVVFFIILFMVEFDVVQRAWNSFKIRHNSTQKPMMAALSALLEDDDVAEERDRINNTDLPNLVVTDRLIIKNLRKVYKSGSTSHVAVDQLCVGIPEAECFGLLGINGAGKTTTFKMITGDYRPTSGSAFLDGYDVRTQLRMAQQRMGYCPQFDALIEQMTGAETLRMFARLRGVPESDIPACINNLGRILHFSEHIDKPCETYSGGNKRKLSTAIALVGNPPVVLLDEPSTGMDPGAKRMLWDAIAAVRSSGCSIVITSHSMEECEALCTRLAIMVNGKLRCLGGPQHLKSKFGEGYTIEMKVKSNPGLSKVYMEDNFPGSTLKDEHQGLLTYHVPQYKVDGSNLNLSMVFELMEQGKSESKISDYTVSQTSLEQVFLSLVRWQREATEVDLSSSSANEATA